MPVLDTDGIPFTDHIRIGMCLDPKCGKLHILLFDEAKKPIMCAEIEDVHEHIKDVQNMAYRAATRRPE